MKDLLHYEQHVNDRFETSAAPPIEAGLLPESSGLVPLKWCRVPESSASVASSGDELAGRMLAAMQEQGQLRIPVHPLDADIHASDPLVRSGSFRTSASYRTVEYVPDEGDPLGACIPDGQVLMLKIHLESPIPDIDGDRRLTRERIEKCVALSKVLPSAINGDPFAEQFEIVPEFLGLSGVRCGVLLRLLPAHGVVPLFSLGSRDAFEPDSPPLIHQLFQQMYGEKSNLAADEFGIQFARPLIRALLAGFRAGFSLEMHAQNTLIRPGSERLIETVLYRDLEGVVMSNRFRRHLGLDPLFTNLTNDEFEDNGQAFSRYFNRNYDHDLGRVFRSVLFALNSSGYFDAGDVKLARQRIRQAFRESVADSGLMVLARGGRLLPFSRAPYGDGLRLGHYFGTEFR